MELDWTPEEEAFRQEVRDLIAMELADDVKGSMFINTPARVAFVDKMAKRGWLGLGFPEKYGGLDMGITGYCVLMEELQRACASHATIVGAHAQLAAMSIYLGGSEAQKQEWLPRSITHAGSASCGTGARSRRSTRPGTPSLP